MSYEPTNWKSGDTVTSAKLNKMEQGIANAGALVVQDVDGTLDHTWQEIHDAAPLVAYTMGGYYALLISCVDSEGSYQVDFMTAASGSSLMVMSFITNSADGYPVMDS